jgi:DNA-binding transcriptional LysR family regulator
MDRYLAIESFVRVAESGSFAEAARQLRISRSVMTLRIQQLETFVGAPLFNRNTRSVKLTDLGQTFLRDCAELVGRTNEVVDQMREVGTSPVGRLRIHALPGFVLGHLAKILQRFQQRYPQIVLDMLVNDAAIDPVKEGFDCALQIFPPRSEELISRKLFPVRRVLCATPEYLRRNGTVRGPRDLMGHRLGWYSGYPTRERLAFHGPTEVVQLDLKPVLLTNSVHLLREYALEHAGVVCLPTLVAADAVTSGQLRIVLPEFQLGSFWLSVFYPTTQRGSLKLKLFLELLAESFTGTPPWDEALIEKGLLNAQFIE